MKRGALCILSTLLLMATVFRPGVRVEVAGAVLPGVYAPAAVRKSAAAADRAAEEICRGEEAPSYRLHPVLCARYTAVDETELARTLLEAYDGVASLYAVYAGSERVGTTDDPGLPGTVYHARMEAWAVNGGGARPALRVERVFTYPEARTDGMTLMRAMGELW